MNTGNLTIEDEQALNDFITEQDISEVEREFNIFDEANNTENYGLMEQKIDYFNEFTFDDACFQYYISMTDRYYEDFQKDFSLNKEEFKILQNFHFRKKLNLNKIFNQLQTFEENNYCDIHEAKKHISKHNSIPEDLNLIQIFLYDYQESVNDPIYKPLFKNIFKVPAYFFETKSCIDYSYMNEMDEILSTKIKEIYKKINSYNNNSNGLLFNAPVTDVNKNNIYNVYRLKKNRFSTRSRKLADIYECQLKNLQYNINSIKDVIDMNHLSDDQRKDFEFIIEKSVTKDTHKLQSLLINLENIAKQSIIMKIFNEIVAA